MRIEWKPDGRPDACRAVAAGTAAILREMDDATSKAAMDVLWDRFKTFARQHRAAQPIVDHVHDKYRLITRAMQAGDEPPVDRKLAAAGGN